MAALIPGPLVAFLRDPGVVICGAIAVIMIVWWLLYPLIF